MIARVLVAFLLGVCGAFAFTPGPAAYVLPFSVAGFVLCMRGLRPRSAWLPGWAYGIGFQFVLLGWMRAVGPDAWVALSAIESVFYAALGSATAALLRLRAWPVLVAVAWLAVDVWRASWPFSGMPWGRLGFATVDTPFAPAAAYVGIPGVSLLVGLLGTLIAWAVLRDRRRWRGSVLVPVVVLAAVCLPALVPFGSASDGSVRVAVVQGNIPGDGTDILLDGPQVTRNHRDATLDLAADVQAGRVPRPDLVVWPENSTTVDPFNNLDINRDIVEASDAIGVPMLVGAMVDATDPRDVLNQGIVWTPGVGAGDRYSKRHPVPFGEYIPWRDTVFSGTFGKLRLIPRDMLSGNRTEPLSIAGTRVADSICFDVGYDDGIRAQVLAGADLMVVQTSNAMFVYTDQIQQQFAITRLRAIESHRAVAVAATNGITGLIGPDGRVLDQADPRTQAVLTHELPLDTTVTPGIRLGIWIGRGAVVTTLLALAFGAVTYRRNRRSGQAAAAPEVDQPVLSGLPR
ncbi:MAG: apolipoprotein N-acyltransferase [Nocardioidaceae bacterium]